MESTPPLSLPRKSYLRQVAEDYNEAYSELARLINENFYVDDVLMGTFTIEEATQICTGLNSLLKEAGMTLRKWRSSSTEFLASIPEELKEKEDLHISTDTTLQSKALGIHWNTCNDDLYISVPLLGPNPKPTKRKWPHPQEGSLNCWSGSLQLSSWPRYLFSMCGKLEWTGISPSLRTYIASS